FSSPSLVPPTPAIPPLLARALSAPAVPLPLFTIPIEYASTATAGSAELDLINTSAMKFTFPYEVQLCDTQIRGPLPSQTVGLILPRSSAHKKGIFVVLGVIDSDYTGILKVQITECLDCGIGSLPGFLIWRVCVLSFCMGY
uniref:dUTPase-like domain-containing protein n=1 Tax=Salvator merianae TaxID=96440 RepID=A0A8D0BCQ4_SALMN